MTPNFALGLTDDGITLWYKDTAGWLRVGAVAVDSPALDTEMSGLAKIAAALAPKGVATKLVIPDAQILFTSLQLPPLPTPEKERAIRAALVGRTPYPVEDLVFDWCDTAAQTHIAVTARETVIEAEDFANTYGLNPVSAVAAPMGKDFAQEPFFCITRTGRSLYPGQVAALSLRDMLREVGIAQLPDPEVIIPKLSEPAPPPAAAKDATSLATQAVAKASLPEAKAPDMPKAEAAQPETTAPLAATSAAPIADPSNTPTSTTERTTPQTPPKAAA
ncbi:MAG: hypothetical protein LAT78_05300, partial [Roseinatronobacter sp.]|nr:hypothetical protein [Roseinatronobacter sp.]